MDYSNIAVQLQSTVINILRNDSTVSGLTSNILDGVPAGLWKGTGFPYILVHTPTIEDTRITTTKIRNDAFMEIEIISHQESVVRTLVDAVRNALKSNQNTTRAENAYLYRNSSGSMNPFPIPGKQRRSMGWNFTMTIEYTVVNS